MRNGVKITLSRYFWSAKESQGCAKKIDPSWSESEPYLRQVDRPTTRSDKSGVCAPSRSRRFQSDKESYIYHAVVRLLVKPFSDKHGDRSIFAV